MQALSKYSFVNAKIRAMLSYLLGPKQLNRLIDARDIHEMSDVLSGTVYGDILDKAGKGYAELENLEKEFIKSDVASYKKVYDMLSTEHEKKFVSLLLERYEIEEIKIALRAWHKKIPVNLESYILSEKINYRIDFEKIVSAPNIEEIIILLAETPYQKPIIAAREKFKEHNSSFYLEISLDRDYYERLILATNGFSATDRRIARRLLGVEIDIANINSLARLRKYYSLGLAEIMNVIIPGGERISKDTVEKMYANSGLSGITEEISPGLFAKLKGLPEDNIQFIENFLYEVLLHEVNKLLAGFPFTIGTVIGYLILKARETRNIISLFYSKALGVKKDEAAALLGI